MRRVSSFVCLFFIGFVCAGTSIAEPSNKTDLVAVETTLNETELAMVSWVDQRKDKLLEELKLHVDINTGTDNIEGLNRYRDLLEKDLKALGFATATHASAPIDVVTCEGGQVHVADHLSATISGGQGQKVLINGHMDTVFSADDEFQTLEVAADGTLKGPGVADMKGGIVIMLNALRALKEHGLLENVNLTVLFNSDEEIGSLGSRALIEQMALQHDIGLVFEGTYGNRVTRARKGLGQARIKVTGRESHSGGAHQEGVSANLELAHKVVELEKLTDYERKLTVNTGVMSGGEKRNTVPGCADAYVDIRYPEKASGEELVAGLQKVAETRYINNTRHPEYPQTEFWAVLHRPVKEQNEVVDGLIREAMGISALVGDPIVGTRFAGGGTDGSIAQGVGLPTMDSLGMDGKGAHSSREESNYQSLIERTKLAAIMLARHLHKTK